MYLPANKGSGEKQSQRPVDSSPRRTDPGRGPQHHHHQHRAADSPTFRNSRGPDPNPQGPHILRAEGRLNDVQRRRLNSQRTLSTGTVPSVPQPLSDPSVSNARRQHGRHMSYQLHPEAGAQFEVALHPSRGGDQPGNLHSGGEPHASGLPSASSHLQPGRAFAPFATRGRGSHPYPHDGRPGHDVGSVTPTRPFRGHQLTGHSSNWRPGSDISARQSALIDGLCSVVLVEAGVDRDDIAEKEAFRVSLESICRGVIAMHEREYNGASNFPADSVQLRCFGSLSSGFATKASDMDLGLLSPESRIQPDAPGSAIPRLVEKALLEAGVGARLLTRTRVPIIKVCETPPPQLLSELRIERERWESGVDMEKEQHPQDDVHGIKDLRITDVEQSQIPVDADVVVSDAPHHTGSTSGNLQHPLDAAKCSRHEAPKCHHWTTASDQLSLRQGENQSLFDYYLSAKRLLRQIRGHDLTISSSQKFTNEDCESLLTTCRLFIAGLRDDVLRERLSAYSSLQLSSAPKPQNLRTLSGIYTQVEGEAMLLKWERCPVQERGEEPRLAVSSAVKAWKMLQGKRVFGFASIQYAKELQTLLERLKRFASMRLVLLEQGPHESASHYSARSMRLFSELISNPPGGQADLGNEIRQRYIAGISYRDIRDAVVDFVGSRESTNAVLFSTVVRRHKSLQLAREFERALSRDLYPDAVRETVRRYINLLRGEMKLVGLDGGRQDWVIPLAEIPLEALSTIRQLQNPSTLAPNQPRDPYSDRLEFPKSGVGVQCDINFSAHLALHNTLLLRCYSHTDSRVRPIVLFVKHWAKTRDINTPYRGTLSSYGYVLMVLHFLVNVAKPFVCPNLQKLAPPPPPGLSQDQLEEAYTCKGRDVRFWRNEQEIAQLAMEQRLNQNMDSVGRLLCGFFEYYAHNGSLSTMPGRGFDWGREVLSLHTMGGLRTKLEKGWTGAKTVTIVEQVPVGAEPRAGEGGKSQLPSQPQHPPADDNPSPGVGDRTPQPLPDRPTHAPYKSQEVKEIRHRYLFAIEDPFELDHNVARTVTHTGIVSIRDEFRRAWRIIQNAGHGRQDEDLLHVPDREGGEEVQESYDELLRDIHGADMGKIL